MKIADINIGQRYIAKVSGSLTTVRVLAIREAWAASGNSVRGRQVIDVVNERTGRRLTFRSAARLRRPVAERIVTERRPAQGGYPAGDYAVGKEVVDQ